MQWIKRLREARLRGTVNLGGEYNPNSLCSGDERCVSGFFTTGVVPDGGPGGPNNGIVIVKLTG